MQYKTKQRDAILDLLRKNNDRHMTADDIYTSLMGSGVKVGKTTVYRYIEALVNEGAVRRYDNGGTGGACFQIVENGSCQTHYHLRCTGCGKLFHLQCGLVRELQQHVLKDHGFAIDGSRTVFYGLCRECIEKKNSEN